MVQLAKVIKTDGQTAKIAVSRASMCAGCSKSGCSDTCSAGALFGSRKETTADAVNKVGAKVGDTVEIETKTSVVMKYALIIFIAPIIVSAATYFIGTLFFKEEIQAVLLSIAGFIVSFLFIGVIEKIKKKSPPDIAIKRIVDAKNEDE